MKRQEAIDQLSKFQLENFSHEERKMQLETFLGENWESDNEWIKLPLNIRKEFKGDSLFEKPNSKKYDEPLLVWLRNKLKSVTNEYLAKELNVSAIEGNPTMMESCPCCGRKTIEKRGEFEICLICWWEDDGQDNKNADEICGGPNYDVSLTQARNYYLTIGIYNPKQIHLKEMQEPADKYPLGRKFKIEDGFVIEIGKNWKGKIKEQLH